MLRLYPAGTGLSTEKISVTPNCKQNFYPTSGGTKASIKYVLALCICLFFLLGFQTPSHAQAANQSLSSGPAAEGTYQLIFNSRKEDKEIKLSQHELEAIEKLRKDNEVVYARATYSDDIRVKILPRNVVNGKSFSRVPLKYYKSEQPFEEYSQIRYVDLQ